MSTSPLPPDPYEALGLNKDCDVDAVKKAHRKLVLKHHPDRIKDPALVEHNQNEFTKVQQAYELLVDPARRRRYDDECKLAQLRRERMSESRPTPTYTTKVYTTRSTPAPTNPVQREPKHDPRYAYEDRVPDSPYVDSTSRSFVDDPVLRSTRKDPFEKRPPTSKPVGGKEKSRGGAWEREKEKTPMSMKTVFGIAGMASNLAQNAKAKNKEREKEMHAKAAKARDKEEHRARDNKNTYARPAFVEDYSEGDESSGSESDTIVTTGRTRMRGPSPVSRPRQSLTPEPPRTRRTLSPMSEIRTSRHQSPRPAQRSTRGLSPGPMPKQTRQPSPRPEARSARQPSPRPEARPLRQPSPRPSARDIRDQRSAYDDDSQDDDKYESHYRNAQDYVFTAQRKDPRPPLSRQGSGVHDQYWHKESGRDRKSGSDSDKQHSSSSQKPSRRSVPDEPKLRPSLFPQSSAPAGVRGMTGAETRDAFAAATRSRGNSYVSSSSNNHRREMPPELKRSPSEPVPQKVQAKRDSVPMKGSSLKQAESMQNGDSGYGSSNPQTPETRCESPHRESRESREGRPREGSSTTKYRVGKAEDGVPISRFLSPQDQPHHHHHHHNPESRERRGSRSREREVEGRHRSSSNRPAHPERQSSFNRNESSSRYEDRDRSRNIRAERSPDRHSRSGADEGYFRSWPGPVKEQRNKAPMFQGPPTPSYTKLYGEASPRSVHQHRGQPSAYAVR